MFALLTGALVAAAGLFWAGTPGRRLLVAGGHPGTPATKGPRTASARVISWNWRRDRAVEAALWVTLIRRLAALLRAGGTPAAVFGRASRSTDTAAAVPTARWLDELCRDTHAAAQLGIPVSVTLGRYARSSPGLGDRGLDRWACSVSVQLAACWEISERSGAALGTTLSGLADSVESQIDAQAARDSALAGPRVTVRVLAWLPMLALGLGILMGTDPVTTLLTTAWGRLALVAGAALTVAGRVWTRQLLRHAEAEDGS